MKKVSYRRRLIILYICSFVTSLLPLIICLIAKKEDYFKSPGETVKLTLGGLFILFLLLLKVLGKFKIPGRTVFFGMLFVLSFLLEAVLSDLALLSGLAFLGDAVDSLSFCILIKRTKEKMLIEKSSEATSEKLEKVIKKYMGGGRV